MNIKSIDEVLKYLDSEKEHYQTVRSIGDAINMKLSEILDVVEFLAEDGYVKKSVIPNEVDRIKGDENMKPEEYWKISIKGMQLISEGGLMNQNKVQNRVQNRLFWVQMMTFVIAFCALVSLALRLSEFFC